VTIKATRAINEIRRIVLMKNSFCGLVMKMHAHGFLRLLRCWKLEALHPDAQHEGEDHQASACCIDCPWSHRVEDKASQDGAKD